VDDAWLAVMADMEARRLVGLDRYGKPVVPTDTREDWLRHAYEEALDLAVYLKAEMLRRTADEPAADPSDLYRDFGEVVG